MICYLCGENRWLSNFQYCEIQYQGYKYYSVQAAYQAQKYIGSNMKMDRMKRIFGKIQPNEAKLLGGLLPLREDWQEVRLKIMQDLIRLKFENEQLKQKLIDTDGEQIVLKNKWHDKFFGKCECQKCNGQGQNYLGRILMKIREELINGKGEDNSLFI